MSGLRAGALVALLLLALPGALLAQARPDTAAAARERALGEAMDRALDRLGERYGQLAVTPHAHGTMVGVALRLPAGSGRDPVGREGTAHLLARVRERQAAALLDPSRAVLSARVDRTATVYTLLATPEAWSQALERVDRLLFDEPVPTALVEEERSRLLGALLFQAGSPVEAFEAEAASLLVEPGSPWATPVRGTLSSVESLEASGVAAWQEAHLSREEAAVALAGPVIPGDVARRSGAGTAPSASDTLLAPGAAPEAAPGADVPWLVGDRVSLVQEVTSAWLSVAYPAPDTLSRTALELLAHLVEEKLDPVPPDPDRYGVEVRLVDTPRGPVLLAQASVLPEALARWEARVLSAVAELAEAPMDEDFFRWKRRRFRTLRLLAETAPESEAARMASDLALLGAARALDQEVWGLDAAALQDAARALGEPRVFLLGPDLAEDGPDGAGGSHPAR